MQDLLNRFLTYIGLFCFLLILVFFIYYYPYLNNQQDMLKCIKDLMASIPETSLGKILDKTETQRRNLAKS